MPSSLERLTAVLADRYRVERELGQGGMAVVYLAEDLKHRARSRFRSTTSCAPIRVFWTSWRSSGFRRERANPLERPMRSSGRSSALVALLGFGQ